MSLPTFFGDQKQDQTLFITIFLTNSTVRSVLWQAQGQLQVTATSQPLAYTDQKSLMVAADESLQELGAESEKTDQVIFALENNWVNQNGILDDKKPILKKITTELSLKAIGFVATTETLVNHLSKNSPKLSALLVGITRTQITLTLLKAGQADLDQQVGRSGDLIADLNEALARLTQQNQDQEVLLPGKFILFSVDADEKEVKSFQQEMLKHPWQDTHKFLQSPVVETLKTPDLIKFVIEQAAQAVVKSKPAASVTPPSTVEKVPTPTTPIQPEKKSHHFGFEELAIDPSLMDKQPVKSDSAPIISQPQEKNPHDHHPRPKTSGHSFKKFWQAHSKLVWAGFGAGLVALVLMAWFFLPKVISAQVLVAFKQETVSQDVKLTLDPDIQSTDLENLLLPATVTNKEVSSSRTDESSGVKLIGDPAEGGVEILNKTDSEKTFSAGTSLNLAGQEFELKDEVTIPAATTNENGDGIDFGKATGQALAKEVGEEGNIKAGEKGTVADFDSSSFSVTTSGDFSGGSSREVEVVSQEDRDSLLEGLTQELITIAEQEFAQESSDGVYLIPSGKSKVVTKSFSAEVGDETNTLTLDLTLEVEAYSYQSQDLKPMAREILSQDLASGLIIDEESIQILSSPSQSEDETAPISLEANLSAQARPDLSLDDLKQTVVGKSITQATQILQNRDEITAVEIKIQPAFLSGLIKSLPSNPDHIMMRTQEE